MSESSEDLVPPGESAQELLARLLASGILSRDDIAGLAATGPDSALGAIQHPTLAFPHARGAAATVDPDDLHLPTMSLAPNMPTVPASGSDLARIGASPPVSVSGARYRMGKVLGKGGMGEVRLATDVALGREVALKRMLDTSVPSQVRRFSMEARVTGRLEHPNIIPVHELGSGEDGAPYFTMKRVKGDSLGDLIAKLKTDFEDTRARYGLTRRLHVFLGITNAIAFAHSHGVLHRDLKPANVMVGEFGEVLVMDWGLVRIAGESTDDLLAGVEPPLDNSGDTGATMVGSVIGTPRYMSPEQARGDNAVVDQRSDVFALGAILCELLVLRPAIPGGTVWQVLEATTLGMRQLPGSLPKDPITPRELTAVVDKAMALDPDARYPTVAALAKDVEAFLEGHVLSAAVYTPLQRLIKWGQRHKMLAGGAAASLLALVLGVLGSISLLHQRALHQAGEILLEAQALRASHDPERAQQACIQALALDSESAPARQLLGLVSLEAEAQRRMRLRAGRISELGAQLERDRVALSTIDPERDLGGWLASQTRTFHAARELAMLYGTEAGQPHRLAAAQTARAIARRMERAGEHQMATLMLAEATQLGLAREQVELDRRVMQVETSQRARQAASEIEHQLSQTTALNPGSPACEALLDDIRRAPHAETVRVLMRALGRDQHTDFAVDALAMLGDRQTTAVMFIVPTLNINEYLDETVWPVAKEVIAELAGPEVSKERHEITAPQYIAHLLLRAAATPAGVDELVRLTEALGRFDDPRTRRAVVLKRWLVGRDSLYWTRSAAVAGTIDEPSDQVERAAGWTPIERALYFEATGRNALALAAYDQLVAGDPSGNWATRRGRFRLETGDAGGALADAELALARGLHPGLALELRAHIHARAGRYAEALGDLDKALDRALRPGPLHIARALALEALGRNDEALAAADRATDADPTRADAHRLRARIRLATNQPALAVVESAAALALDPKDEAALTVRARANSALGLPFAARADVLALARYEDLDGSRALAVARNIVDVACSPAATRDAFRRAWGIARDVIARHPRSGEAHEVLGRALLLDGGVELSSALEAFRAARALGHAPARMRAWEGVALVHAGRYAEGAAALDESQSLDPPVPEAFVAIASLRAAEGKLDEAAQMLMRADELQPRSGMALLELARLELRRNDRGRAIEHLVKAADRPATPQHWRVVIQELLVRHLVGRADEQARAGKIPEALADVELAMRYPTLMPDLRDVLKRMHQALTRR